MIRGRSLGESLIKYLGAINGKKVFGMRTFKGYSVCCPLIVGLAIPKFRK